MFKLVSILLITLLFASPFCLEAQNSRTERSSFYLKGNVVESETNKPVSRVNVEISGGAYTTTNIQGDFSINAKIGDELIIRSVNFNTVYYTVKDQQHLTVKVENAMEIPKASSVRKKSVDVFKSYIDSAKIYLKKDAKKSIEYVTKALESVPGRSATAAQNQIAFETLGDINLYYEQQDLAIDNYNRSLLSGNNIDIRIKLAGAFRKNKNYQESITEYSALLKSSLSNYQKVQVYEGLGDTYKAINDGSRSVANYQQGLAIATKHSITPKITDLNSKIGEVFAQSGAVEEAESYFGNSLNLSKKEGKKRAVEEKNKVADFYNQNRDFEKEIQLREETLDEIKSLDDGTIEADQNSPLTPQRQNYKIANAFVGQEKFKEAIPYLEKSIVEADKKEDLLVKKDATRKLSELYRDIGEYDKASKSYERYANVVDELYAKKDQELSQAARFSKEITLRQTRIASLENDRKLNESRYKLAVENQELIQKNNLVQKWVIGSLILIALLLLYTAYTQYKSVKQQKYANNQLSLKSLRTQMNPHFIFNALNSVNSFIASNDERAANKYLSEFSQLMRSVLENSEEDFIPLEKEIDLLELYVKLEHFRFKDKFDYNIRVSEKLNLNEFVIPPMLLQPYVENAVWHGLRYKEERGKLEIEFEQVDSETAKITITDNGIGRKKSQEFKTENQKKQKSKGMGNIQKRITILNEMYKDKVDVLVENVYDNEEGTRVVLILKKD
ncbi:histidine kinase [Ulvibacter antarcticus]|uniref:Histidine kinase n=1 Tax=Ulvibacter antarcticus TaxID=442714 RepID=A0A3L9Y7K1_9FLAO|nr:histidine kinase [Ulvibacter antarcticus]RMA56683.1 histidine kinase [Ulvibacter antarcticus]